MRALSDNCCHGVTAVPAAATNTATRAAIPPRTVVAAGATAIGLLATTADGGAAPAARQPAPLQAAPVAAAQQAAPQLTATATDIVTAPVGESARPAARHTPFPAAPISAPVPRGSAEPQRRFCGAAAAAPGSPCPASAGWAATPGSAPGVLDP